MLDALDFHSYQILQQVFSIDHVFLLDLLQINLRIVRLK